MVGDVYGIEHISLTNCDCVNKMKNMKCIIGGPTSSEGWREAVRWPTLKTSRAPQPRCARIGQKGIIAGGWNGEPLNFVEESVEGSSSWKAVHNLVERRAYFDALVLPRQIIC